MNCRTQCRVFMGMVAEEYIAKREETLQQKEQFATILLDDSRPARANFDAKKEADAIEKTFPSQLPNQDSIEQTRRELANRLSQNTPDEFDQIVKQMQSELPGRPDVRHPYLSVESSNDQFSVNLGADSNNRIFWDSLNLPVQRWNSADTGKSLQNSFCLEQSDSKLTEGTQSLKSLSARQISTIADGGYLYCKK